MTLCGVIFVRLFSIKKVIISQLKIMTPNTYVESSGCAILLAPAMITVICLNINRR
ncbi:hypothetical protein TUM12149_11180 [Morganella morganii]|nr:hypothetical protein TUM12149_11180 [Morganella morganii]GIZ32459.1 hypothetical protein TUM12150_29450 [Morganella morganii]